MSAKPSRPRARRHAKKSGAKPGAKSGAGMRGPFAPPPTVSRGALLVSGDDMAFREMLYLMVLAFGRLITCREAFGQVLGLTGSQFAVLFGVAHRQGREGVSIRAL